MSYEYNENGIFHETVECPPGLIPTDDTEAKVSVYFDEMDAGNSNDNILLDTAKLLTKSVKQDVEEVQRTLESKSFEYSNQSTKELSEITNIVTSQFQHKVQPTPYDPDSFANFLEINEVHFRAVKVKVQDSVGRRYRIKSKYPIRKEGVNEENEHGFFVTEEQFQTDCKKITEFLSKVHDCKDFVELCSSVAMDREGIGWGAFEVIREASGKIARLQHLPAVRLRVLEGWTGFVEITEYDQVRNEYKYIYYQPFGQKVGKWVDDPFDLSKKPKKVFRPYEPELDGDLIIGGDSNLVWNFASKETGERLKGRKKVNFQDAANEILYLPNTHSNTIYYGYADVVPAIGAILGNVQIRDFQLQYYEHNCVPRYVVIIKGAKVDEEFKKYITEYFKTKVKGSAYHTMILTLSGMANKNISIEFKKIDADQKEADFRGTKKDNDQIIMTAEGVSSALLAINESASLGSGKGLSQAELYKDRIVLPLQLFWARRLNTLFRQGLGCLYAEIEFDPLDTRDALSTAQVLNILLTTGTLTINEARRELGLTGSLDGGDVPFVRIRQGSFVKIEDIPKLKTVLSDSNSTPEEMDEKVGDIVNGDIELGE